MEALEAVTHLYFFTRILWSLSPTLGSAGLATAAFGTSASLILGRARLARLFREERKATGTFSHNLSRCRENLESIQFAGAVDYELARINRLDQARQDATISRKREKDLISMFSLVLRRLAGGVMPSLILRREHEEKEHEHSHQHHNHHHGHSHSTSKGLTIQKTGSHPKPLGGGGDNDEMVSELAQATDAFDEILFHLLIVTENFHNATRLVTIGNDICQLLERENQTSKRVDNAKYLTLISGPLNEGDEWLNVQGLTVTVPSTGQVLLDNLSLSLKYGDTLLVTGVSGSGKTALLRVLFGLWPAAGNAPRVVRPSNESVMVLPQKPFCSSGTLAEQVSYPRPAGEFSQEAIRDALKAVGLGHLLERYRLDGVEKWQEQLSMGEQQRIGFSRVVLHRPLFAFLDESSSNLDLDSETKMYELVSQIVVGGFVSIGHRRSIEKYHLHKIVMQGPQGQGSWKQEF